MLAELFGVSLAAAVVTNFLDWKRADTLIKKEGLAGERNPIMRALFSKSKYAALAYKAFPISLLAFCWIHYQNGEYTNEHAWGIAWVITALGSTAAGLYGYLMSK